MSTPNPERDAAMDKIRKLLNMTAANGASEQEAMTATSQAEKLMRKYQVDFADIIMEDMLTPEDTFEQDHLKASFEKKNYNSKTVPSWVGITAVAIGKFTGVKIDVFYSQNEGACVRFSGYSMDVIFAKWLHKFICETNYNLSRKQTSGVGGAAAFRLGFSQSVASKLYKMKQERDAEFQQQGPTGTGLVLYRTKEQAVKEFYGETKTKQSSHQMRDSAAHEMGAIAGSKLNIPTNSPIAATQSRGRLH